MTQIIEYTKHSDNYLIHHFDFECNDKTSIGKFAGNCSLNKYMSLHDWHQIFDDLNGPVQSYVNDPDIKPAKCVQKIDDTNFELNIAWEETDMSFYRKLLHSIDFDLVFPYVIKINVCLRSNVDKFISNGTVKMSATKKSTDRKKTINKTPKNSIKTSMVITNGALFNHDNSIKLKECCVRLPLLRFDENGDVIQNQDVRNKRKHSEISNGQHSASDDQIGIDEPNEMFVCSSSSTPFVRTIDVELKRIANDVRGNFKKIDKRLTNRLTQTPRSSHERKSGTQFNPRIRLLKMPDSVSKLNASKKSKRKNADKKLAKSKTKKMASKKLKEKVRSIVNESDLFETPTPKRKSKKATAKASQCIPTPHPIIIKIEESDLKSLTEQELWKSFDDHYEIISNLFSNYLKQTDATVIRANDYNHFDMISLLSTDQFSVLLDILFDKLVKIGEFGEINYDALFLELLIPEWVLAIYMQSQSLDRETAIRQITLQRTNHDQSLEGYTTLITSKLDDTMNIQTSKNVNVD